MLHFLNPSHWLAWARANAISAAALESLAFQVCLVAALFAASWGIRAATRPATDRLVPRFIRSDHTNGELSRLLTLTYAWLLLVIAEGAASGFGMRLRLVGIAATLTALWIVLRGSSLLFRDALLARLVAVAAWIIAALEITGLLGPATTALNDAALTIGSVRLSLLLAIKAVLLIAILLWGALALARLIGARIQHLSGLSPSIQLLARNLVKIALVFLALLIGLNAVGIDLTAFTVFSGAIGVGLGFGLQKIVSNFVSGIILLVERSIKPGDVIEVGQTYGCVTSLGARYTSVRGRDGKEYLIPNETLITNQVVNWSYTNRFVRLDLAFGVAYGTDLRLVRRLAIEAAQQTPRVLETPAALCHVTELADSGINLVLRFWIEDPFNGITNIRGDIFLLLWDRFVEHGIEVPFPQRDLHIRDVPAALARPTPAATRSAAE
ncbi:MAG TPA: mechanosensitive ion channel domain-containing protein [Stellaceae bacterium]|nr:mechanosensitive ion channel domain-containing protein [Stellaceae bacterium]